MPSNRPWGANEYIERCRTRSNHNWFHRERVEAMVPGNTSYERKTTIPSTFCSFFFFFASACIVASDDKSFGLWLHIRCYYFSFAIASMTMMIGWIAFIESYAKIICGFRLESYAFANGTRSFIKHHRFHFNVSLSSLNVIEFYRISFDFIVFTSVLPSSCCIQSFISQQKLQLNQIQFSLASHDECHSTLHGMTLLAACSLSPTIRYMKTSALHIAESI